MLKWRSSLSSGTRVVSQALHADLGHRGRTLASALPGRQPALPQAPRRVGARGGDGGPRGRAGGGPDSRPRVCDPHGERRAHHGLAPLQPMARGAPPGGPGALLRAGRPQGHRPRPLRPAPLPRAHDPAPPAGPDRAARAALPGAQDHRRAALPLLNESPVPSPQSPELLTDPVADLQGAVSAAAGELRGNGLPETPGPERPPRPDFGDYPPNAAMMLAGSMGEPPRAVAERLSESLGQRLGSAVERVEVAGPGFLNLFMADAWYLQAVAGLAAAGEDYGASAPEAPERTLVEFVSANPTGPITVAAARHAAYGDALSRMLELAGHSVEREYYVNDYGSQIRRFAESIQARARGKEPPEDGYRGDYVMELAQRLEGAADADLDELAERAVGAMLEEVRRTLDRFRVHFDRFFSERSLHDGGELQQVLDQLEEREHLYPHDGAVWLRTTDFGDDKDRVLMRSSGEMTYFATDIAYHEDKRGRGYDRVITVLGADHHGYTARMKAAWQALGGDPGRAEWLIMQLVNLMEGGRRSQMSKRKGDIVTLDELLDDIGVDAARYFLLQRSHDTPLDLDLELARERSQDNPVYYVQYAHARIASILRRAGDERVAEALAADLAASSEELHPSTRALIKRLLEFPAQVREAAERRAPHRMTAYVHETAQDFSAFYRDVRVVGAAEEGGDEDLRLALSVLTMRVLARGLDLLGVEAPEQM